MYQVMHWLARMSAVAAIVPLTFILLGEHGAGPAGPGEWAYLALFPIGFSIGYAAGWRWPLAGGCISLVCLAASLLVVGRTFPLGAYIIWGVVSLPGVLFVIAGLTRSNFVDPHAP